MIIGWLIVLAAVVGLGIASGGKLQNTKSIPGSAAQTALPRMDQHWQTPDDQSAQIVFQAPTGHKLAEPRLQGPLRTNLAAAGRVLGVASVGDPAADGSSPAPWSCCSPWPSWSCGRDCGHWPRWPTAPTPSPRDT